LSLPARILNGCGAIEIATRKAAVETPFPSLDRVVAVGDYSVVEIKHWDGRNRSVLDTQRMPRLSTIGPAIAFEAVAAADGYVVYGGSDVAAVTLYLPAAAMIETAGSGAVSPGSSTPGSSTPGSSTPDTTASG
jgi:hypothetical protein